ncbi:MAG: AAA family ATPase, partial [Flavobacteriales bacterium]
ELTGIPEMSFELQNEREQKASLQQIFRYLENSKKVNYIAIDEFQQIDQYPETNTEKILRSHIQHLKNCRFIFSGSQKHLLLPMFSDSKRAFYQSTDFLHLKKIERNEYKEFIQTHFQESNY